MISQSMRTSGWGVHAFHILERHHMPWTLVASLRGHAPVRQIDAPFGIQRPWCSTALRSPSLRRCAAARVRGAFLARAVVIGEQHPHLVAPMSSGQRVLAHAAHTLEPGVPHEPWCASVRPPSAHTESMLAGPHTHATAPKRRWRRCVFPPPPTRTYPTVNADSFLKPRSPPHLLFS